MIVNIQLFLVEDLVNLMTGEVVATIGQELTESLVLQLNQYGISRYEVTIWKPAEDEDLPFDEDTTMPPLVIEDPSLNLDLSLLDNTDDLIFFDEWESL